MPAIIDSAPSCITAVDGAKPADDSADFILQAAYENCAGIMTFGPGSTYGEGGAAAAGAYYVLTWIGIIFMVAVLVALGVDGEPPAARAPAAPARRVEGRDRRDGGRMMDDDKQIEFPPLQTHDKRFEAVMVGAVDPLRHHRARDRAVHQPWQRVPSHGLTTSPGSSGAAPRHPARGGRRGRAVRGDVRRREVLPGGADPDRPAQAVEIARPEAGFAPDRTQVRLVRQGLNGRPFWAVSFSDARRGSPPCASTRTRAPIAAVNKER